MLVENLEQFSNLDQRVAMKLFDIGRGDAVAEYLDNFFGLDHREIALKLIDLGKVKAVADNIERFS